VPLVAAPWNPQWNQPQSGWNEQLTSPEQPRLNTRLYITDEDTIRLFREGVTSRLLPLKDRPQPDGGLYATLQQDGKRTTLHPIQTEAGWALEVRRPVSPTPSNGEAAAESPDQAEPEAQSPTEPASAAQAPQTQTVRFEQTRVRPLDQETLPDERVAHRMIHEFRSPDGTRRYSIVFEQVVPAGAEVREGQGTPVAVRVPLVRPLPEAPWAQWTSYYRQVFQAIPWGAWIAPLSFWLVFIAGSYGIFYSLTYLVMGYWSGREKLIFPLARLPQSLLPSSEDEQKDHFVTEILRSFLFWAGFAVAGFIMSWNALVSAGALAGLDAISLGLPSGTVDAMISGNPVLGGLKSGSGGGLSFLIIFTAIGIAFLLPTEISFSSWSYNLIGKLLLLVMIWIGLGQNLGDFPRDWLWAVNPVSALGGGGLIFFSLLNLYRAAKEYIVLAFKPERTLGERLQIGLPLVGLVLSVGLVTWWVHRNIMSAMHGEGSALFSIFWAFIFVAIATLLTLGFMRIVAESGIFWFQNHMSFFHVYKIFGLGSFFPPALLAPLLPIYSVQFLELKTFIAPNLLNAAKLQEDQPTGRKTFHITLLTCLIVTVLFSLGYAIFLAHLSGAQQMNHWFYTVGPKSFINKAQLTLTNVPEVQWPMVTWFALGVAWIAFTVFIRRSVFWFPHPIGFIMLVNPLMDFLWFSFFLGWLFKSIIVKYGGKLTFDRIRMLFIGLILGELMAIFVWTMLGLVLDWNVGLTLNRYG
jgi:hypothetical protein